MRTLSFQELSVGDLVFDIYPQTHYIQLGVITGFTKTQVKLKMTYYEKRFVKPHYLIVIDEKQANDFIQKRDLQYNDSFYKNSSLEIIDLHKKLKAHE
jgi:hypothetical protein